MDKKKILVLNGQYLPGYKGGGPIQSCVNMIENLSGQYEFYVLTADRDFKSEQPYNNIKINEWNKVGAAKVFYMSPDRQNINGFKDILTNIDFDILYLNGFFSPIFTIKPLILKKLGYLRGKKVILTPRGDFTGGCENKKLKKYSYIYLCKIFGLYDKLLWHATSELEKNDIKNKFKNANIVTVPNLTSKYIPMNKTIVKREGELKLVFISRIFPKKNLKFVFEILKEIKEVRILFDIYGPMEDEHYWNECQEVIKELPSNIRMEYKGEIEHCEIERTFSDYHAFIFPTLGENYGHVIAEAIKSECVLLISNTTPWNELEENEIGWDIALDDKEKFINAIYELAKMNNELFHNKLKKVRVYAKQKFNCSNDLCLYEELFRE